MTIFVFLLSTSKVIRIVITAMFAFQNVVISYCQSSKIDLNLGANAIYPSVIGGGSDHSKFTHNFWFGFDYSGRINSRNQLHLSLYTNGVNYRFSSADSPTTTFITMNYLSVPLQFELTAKSKPWGILLGYEPKWYITGHEYTAEPTKSKRIDYSAQDQVYSHLNMGIRAGFIVNTNSTVYFLQASADILPFRHAGASEYYDRKIIFGFRLTPVWSGNKS